MNEIIFGVHPVLEALRAGVGVERILLARGKPSRALAELRRLAEKQRLPVQEIDKASLQRRFPGNTQGVVAYVRSVVGATVETILQEARKRREPSFIGLLDGIEDPHNLGAILRSADGAGVHGVIFPKRRSAGLTGTVAKTSAGASVHVNTVQVSNLSTTIDGLKKREIWFVGADQQGTLNYTDVDLTGPVGIVVGAEGRGLHRLVKSKCDFLVRIPMHGKVNSLNASVAAALLFFEVRRQRAVKK